MSIGQRNMVIQLLDQGLYLNTQLNPNSESILLINEESNLIDEFRISANLKNICIIEDYGVREVKLITQKNRFEISMREPFA